MIVALYIKKFQLFFFQTKEQEKEICKLKKEESSLLVKLSEQEKLSKKVLEGVKSKFELFLEQCRRNFHESRLQYESEIVTSKHLIGQLQVKLIQT